MDIAGLSYRIDGDHWICDDERVYADHDGKNLKWRLKLRPEQRPLYHRPHNGPMQISLIRYVYVAVYGYTPYKLWHTCKNSKCINPDHMRVSTPTTRRTGDESHRSICLNCFNLLRVENTHGKLVYCCMNAHKDGEAFPIEEAFANKGLIRPRCPDYEHEDGYHWTSKVYKNMKRNILQPALL